MQICAGDYELMLIKPTPLSDLIVSGRYSSSEIEASANIAARFKNVSAKLVQFFEQASAEEAIEQMAEHSMRQASFVELLCFAIKYPQEGRDVWIAALGTVLEHWQGYNFIPIIRYNPFARRL